MHIYVIGYPSSRGGANTELWHTLKLWRFHGVEITLVPSWSTSKDWRDRTSAIGCRHYTDGLKIRRDDLHLPDGSVAIAFCRDQFIVSRQWLQNCRLIYVPCMSAWREPIETLCHQEFGPYDAYVFQSEYQRSCLQPIIERYGKDFHESVIRGAFDVRDFPYSPLPHINGCPFVIGRLSRHDPRKFSMDLWDIYTQIPNSRGRVMGWNRHVEKYIGRPPESVEVLSQCQEPALDFLRSLHAMVMPGGVATENWPQVVLEAMSAGVPVITDNRGGVREMIRHGETGYLCKSDDEFVHYATLLAENEGLRIEVASRARSVLEEELANPDTLWVGWERVFEAVGR